MLPQHSCFSSLKNHQIIDKLCNQLGPLQSTFLDLKERSKGKKDQKKDKNYSYVTEKEMLPYWWQSTPSDHVNNADLLFFSRSKILTRASMPCGRVRQNLLHPLGFKGKMGTSFPAHLGRSLSIAVHLRSRQKLVIS